MLPSRTLHQTMLTYSKEPRLLPSHIFEAIFPGEEARTDLGPMNDRCGSPLYSGPSQMRLSFRRRRTTCSCNGSSSFKPLIVIMNYKIVFLCISDRDFPPFLPSIHSFVRRLPSCSVGTSKRTYLHRITAQCTRL